jgi:predicted PurR-regulated permease PerM
LPDQRAGVLTRSDWDYTRRLLITVAVLGLTYFVWLISGILLLLFAAILLAVVLTSFADLIAQHTPVPASWSLSLAVIITVAAFVAFLVIFGSQITGQIAQVTEKLLGAIDAVGQRIGAPTLSAHIETTIGSGFGPSVL